MDSTTFRGAMFGAARAQAEALHDIGRLGRIASGNHLVGANDEPEPGELTPEDVDAEVRRIESDAQRVRRQDERAPVSFFEQQFMRDHGQ